MSFVSLLLDKTCTVERQTPTADAVGSNAPTWATRLSAVSCAIQSYRHGHPNFGLGRDETLGAYILYTSSDIQATRQDRILIGTTRYVVLAYLVESNTLIADEPLCMTLLALRS